MNTFSIDAKQQSWLIAISQPQNPGNGDTSELQAVAIESASNGQEALQQAVGRRAVRSLFSREWQLLQPNDLYTSGHRTKSGITRTVIHSHPGYEKTDANGFSIRKHILMYAFPVTTPDYYKEGS